MTKQKNNDKAKERTRNCEVPYRFSLAPAGVFKSQTPNKQEPMTKQCHMTREATDEVEL